MSSERVPSTASSGVHLLPVSVVTKDSGSYTMPASKVSRSRNSGLRNAARSERNTPVEIEVVRAKAYVNSRIGAADFSSVCSESCSASSCDEADLSTGRHHRKNKYNRNCNPVDLGGMATRDTITPAQCSTSVKDSLSGPSSPANAPTLESSDSVSSAPLNLCLKQQRSVSVSPQPPVLVPALPIKKKRYKPKSMSLVDTETFDRSVKQDDLVSESSYLHPRHKAAKKQLMAQRERGRGTDSRSRSSSPHVQTNKLKSPPTPHVVITTATSSAQPKSNVATPNIVTITAIPSSTKGISLLTGAPAILKSMPDASSPGASRTSLLMHAKARSSHVPSSVDGSPSKRYNVQITSRTENGADDADDANKHLIAKFRTLEDDTSDDDSSDDDSSDSDSSSKSETSSSSSDSASSSSDTEDTEKSHTTSTGSTPLQSSLPGSKRSNIDRSGTSSPVKRRRINIDEKELRIPLEFGWRRQTKIRTFSYSGVRGVVTYYAPCGKKLKTYPEVIRYLDKNKITDITRENFSFSTKVTIGEFLEPTDGGSEFVPLGEQEVIARIEEVRACTRRRAAMRAERHRNKQRERNKLKDQTGGRRDHKFHHPEMGQSHRRGQRQRRETPAAKEARKMRAMQAKQVKEHERLIRQQEKYEKQEQLRVEKEMRAHQMIEEREMKRQQAVFLKEQVRFACRVYLKFIF